MMLWQDFTRLLFVSSCVDEVKDSDLDMFRWIMILGRHVASSRRHY